MAKGGARNITNGDGKRNNKDKNKLKKTEHKAVRSQTKPKVERSPLDILKWILVFAGIAGGIYANIKYATVALGVRAAVGIVLVIVLLAIAAWTKSGNQALAFIKSARGELRKVVWPTRAETMQTALVVFVVVVITALVLWGLDAVLLWAMGWVTGQRG